MDQADCVLVFGAGLNQRTTSYGMSLPAGVPVIQVDRDRNSIGRWFDADVAVVADARLARRRSAVRGAARARRRRAAVLHAEATLRVRSRTSTPARDFAAGQHPRTVDPRSLALELDQLLPPVRNVVYDAGNFLGSCRICRCRGRGTSSSPATSPSIGLGFGTALGFAAARPGETTVLVIGDGGLLMTLGELETVVREDLPLVIVLMNDCAYGAELHFLKMRDMPVGKSVFPDVDYRADRRGLRLPDGDGAHARRSAARSPRCWPSPTARCSSTARSTARSRRRSCSSRPSTSGAWRPARRADGAARPAAAAVSPGCHSSGSRGSPGARAPQPPGWRVANQPGSGLRCVFLRRR